MNKTVDSIFPKNAEYIFAYYTYTFVLEGIYRDQRFRNHSKNLRKAIKADKRLRTIVGRLVSELERNLEENRQYDELLSIFNKILFTTSQFPP